MAGTATHPDYDAALLAWLRARDVLAGEDAVKKAGEKYLQRMDSQTDGEYAAYLARGARYSSRVPSDPDRPQSKFHWPMPPAR